MRRLIWIVLALLPCIAFADSVRDRAEASMVVTGWIQVAQDGSVIKYTLDQQEKLDAPVVGIIAKTIATWKFKPVLVDGKPVPANARMSLRVVVSHHGKDEYQMRVRGASFGEGNEDYAPNHRAGKVPLYPVVAVRHQIEATVYLALEVDRTGHVEQAIAQQVDLRVSGSERELRGWRQLFADASLAATKDWTFNTPMIGPRANEDHWTVIVPVNFQVTVGGEKPKAHQYGQWDVYTPGPVQPVPWDQELLANGDGAVDALPDGDQVFMPDKRFVLLNPPGS